LFERKLDIATDRSSAGFAGSPIGCFHDSGPASGHDRETKFCNCGSHAPGKIVVRAVLFGSGGAEGRHAWPDKMEDAKSPEVIAEDFQKREQFARSPAGSFEHILVASSVGRSPGT